MFPFNSNRGWNKKGKGKKESFAYGEIMKARFDAFPWTHRKKQVLGGKNIYFLSLLITSAPDKLSSTACHSYLCQVLMSHCEKHVDFAWFFFQDKERLVSSKTEKKSVCFLTSSNKVGKMFFLKLFETRL